jgi:hypothetical protein
MPIMVLMKTEAFAQKTAVRKAHIAVLDFESREGVGRGEAASLSDIFCSRLAETGAYIIVERNRIKVILDEQGFQQSEACSNVECIVEAGKILKVEKIFAGVIGKIGRLYTVNIQMVDVATGQIQINKSRQHEGAIEDLATIVMPEMASEMTEQLTGKEVYLEDVTPSRSGFKRHEIEAGWGGGPKGDFDVFSNSNAVRLSPMDIITVAYHYYFGTYFGLGIRYIGFFQKVQNFPSFDMSDTLQQALGIPKQTLTISYNYYTFQGRWVFFQGSFRLYGTLFLGYANGTIKGDVTNGGLTSQKFGGPAYGIGGGPKISLSDKITLTVELRNTWSIERYSTDTPDNYGFNSEFPGTFFCGLIMLSYRF